MAALMTGGDFSIQSQVGKGTRVRAVFGLTHIDRMPLGDMADTMCILMRMQRADQTFPLPITVGGRRFFTGQHGAAAGDFGRRSPEHPRKCIGLISGGYMPKKTTGLWALAEVHHNMKSLAELQALRDSMKGKIGVRDDAEGNIRVVVGMATCGIAAGARPVLAAFTEEVSKRNLQNVTIAQTGCIGICQYEPVVEVYEPGKEKVTYVKMTPGNGS